MYLYNYNVQSISKLFNVLMDNYKVIYMLLQFSLQGRDLHSFFTFKLSNYNG